MKNTRISLMQKEVEKGEAKDVSPFLILNGSAKIYDLPEEFFEEGKDYCDTVLGVRIWSIGRSIYSGRIFASTDTCYYQNPDYECLWLR